MSAPPEGGSLASAPAEPIFEVFCSRHFTGWLAEARLSLDGGRGTDTAKGCEQPRGVP